MQIFERLSFRELKNIKKSILYYQEKKKNPPRK